LQCGFVRSNFSLAMAPVPVDGQAPPAGRQKTAVH
jgi:hypothetical protein